MPGVPENQATESRVESQESSASRQKLMYSAELVAVRMCGKGHHRTRAKVAYEVLGSRLGVCKILKSAYGLLQIGRRAHPLGKGSALHFE
jgi:hypothetical protein